MRNSCYFLFISIESPTLWQFLLWLFKLVILEDFVFSCSRQVGPHNSVVLLYCYLAFIISWGFSLIEINCFTLVSIIVIIFSSLSLSLSHFCLWGFISLILPLSAPAEEVVNSFIFHMKFTACAQMLAKNIASLFLVLVCDFYDSIFLWSNFTMRFMVRTLKPYVSRIKLKNLRKCSLFMGLHMMAPQDSSVFWA